VLALALMAAFSGWRCLRGGALETDLLAMLPATGKNPVAEAALRSLALASGERAVFLVSADSPARSKAAALELGARLARSGAFRDVQTTLPPIDPGEVVRFYLPRRFRVAPATPAESADILAERVQARLVSPQSGMTGISAAQDPLGDFGAFLSALPMGAMRMEIQDDLLVIKGPDALHVLISGSLKGSPFEQEPQKQVALATAAATRDLSRTFPEARILRTGAIFYAIDARETAERETNLISGSSILCIVLLFLWTFRSLRHLLLGLAGVAAGFIVASATCLLVFGKLYLLTLVCGSSVMGVAVDYSFLYFANHLGCSGDWRPRVVLRRLMKPLTLGLATTVLGYATLMVAPFPGLRQIALFSMVGLVGAFLTVICVLPDLLPQPIPGRPVLLQAMHRLLRTGTRLAERPQSWLWLGLAGLLVAGMATRIRLDDSVQSLIQPSRALQTEESRIHALTGLSTAASFILVEGRDEGQVLEREEAVRDRLRPLLDSKRLEGVQAISAFVPSPARQEENLRSHRALAPIIPEALATAGFKPSVALALAADRKAAERTPLTVAAWFQLALATPYKMLWLGSTPQGMASVIYPMGSPDSALLRQACASLPGVTLVDKPQAVSELLGHYRRISVWALGAAILLVYGVLAWIYGRRPALAALAPSLFGILLAVAGLALTHTPLTLFSTLALTLVLGFGVDYAIFLMEGGNEDPSGLLGVLLASLATLISYGLLVFSHTPVLRGFALAVALGVLGSVSTAFFALGREGRR
jgi:predicted exporter